MACGYAFWSQKFLASSASASARSFGDAASSDFAGEGIAPIRRMRRTERRVKGVLAVIDEGGAGEEELPASPAATGVVGVLEEVEQPPAPAAPRLLPRDRRLAEALGVDSTALRGTSYNFV